MLLKTIEIHGFKSFAEKTVVDLGRGVTCLVGPNGCGKSNVVDAVKWALGEQRPSALRGDAMADVIFKGNGRRPAMGFAEVTLIFDNENGELPIELTDVAISRRLYRNGESEYLINRRPVRLKDVRELFYDTGLGNNTYAVLEQGRIDAILRANPVDRRAIFEEAAGIMRFRTRRREAMRKLEKVDQNLLRVDDLLNELEARIRSLKVQAGRARTYVELTKRLSELKTVHFLRSAAGLAVRAQQLKVDLDEARNEDGAAQRSLEEATAQIEQCEAEARVVRDEITRLNTDLAEVRADIGTTSERQGALRQRMADSEQAAEERDQQLAILDQDRQARSDELQSLQSDLASLELKLREAELKASAQRDALLSARVTEAEHGKDLEELEQEAAGLAQRDVRMSNEVAGLESEARAIGTARERLVRREVEISSHLQRVRSDAAVVEDQLARLDQDVARHARAETEARDSLAHMREREDEMRKSVSSLQTELAACASRCETLDAVIERMEGVEEGSRLIVGTARENSDQLPGVRGLLGELLPVSRDRARAFDAALGPLAGAVVVENKDSLRRCLDFLASKGGGHATFVVLDHPSPAGDATGGPGVSLLDGVEFFEEGGDRGELHQTLRALLGSARLVSTDDELLEHLGSGGLLVTADGARLEPCGAMSNQPSSRTRGPVERKVERDQLAHDVELLRSQLDQVQVEEERVVADIAEFTRRAAEAERLRIDVESGSAEARSELERLGERTGIYQRELSVAAHERFGLEHESDALRERKHSLDRTRIELREKRSEHDAERKRLASARAAAMDSVNRLAEAEAVAAREAVVLAERVRGGQAEISAVKRNLVEQETAMERVSRERDELRQRAQQAGNRANELDTLLAELHEKRAELGLKMQGLTDRTELTDRALEQARTASREATERHEVARGRLHELDLKEREVALNLQTLRERALEEIELDLDQGLETFDPESVAPQPEIESELQRVRERVARIGNVNLDAIQELEQVEERLEFLGGEREDLRNSRSSLEQTIRELDAVSRQQFSETFDAVREHFRALFRKLFHGGKADVMLTEGEDVLDAGIEIIAGPPGKDPRSITLLSGGERSMTAIALLFALFKAKPAPIAVLDEVDAALDEANIERFCALLADFIGSSQFLIVSHSKRTMSYADVIIGVTMQESGVSTRIAISMEEDAA